MPEHVFTIPALGHAIDAETNNLTIFSVLEQLGSAAFPFVVPQFSIVTLWERRPGEEDADLEYSMRVIDPNGTEVVAGVQPFRLVQPRHRMVVKVAGARFMVAGTHRIDVRCRRVGEPEWGPVAGTFRITVVATAPPHPA